MKYTHKPIFGHLNESLGKLLEYNITEHGLEMEVENALVFISVYSENIIRVRAIRKDSDRRDFSYAVIGSPVSNAFQVKPSKDVIELSTKSIVLKISQKPVRLTFEDSKGNILCQDDEAFGISWIGNEVACYKTLQPNEKFIGLGEKTGNLNRRGSAYTNWNTDAFAYGAQTDPLYASIPFYIGIHENGIYGIFFDNTYKTTFNFGASNNRFSFFKAEDGEMNYYFIAGKNVAQIIEHYTSLTGRMELPPLWSLGYQQCRYSYYPDYEVIYLAQNFRNRDIPADVLYLDIHYMEKYKVFTWDKKRFPQPAEMLRKLKEMGFHVIVIIDPGVKIEEGYEVYQQGIEKDVFVKYPDGTPYAAQVWPGWCYFPDFTKPKTREWWASLHQNYIQEGIAGFWNDMNEPACWGQNIPDLIEFNYEGHLATHKKARNVYGMQMARATSEGLKKFRPHERSLVLTRAAYAGAQRYAALWTGDNVSNDESMLVGVRLVNSLGISGMPFVGYDVGGFVGTCSPQLFARWISIATFAPFFRTHTMINDRDSEPWSYGEEVEEISRNYIKFRYQMKPYLYSTFYQATQSGLPIARSLAIEYPYDEMIYQPSYQNEFMFGEALLVCPIESGQAISKVYLPKGNWYSLYDDTHYAGKQEIFVETPKEKLPVFVKAGSIFLTQKAGNHYYEVPDSILHIHLYKGKEDCEFVFYEDDGISYEYREGNYYKRKIKYKAEKSELILKEKEGSFICSYEKARLYFHGFESIHKAEVNKQKIKAQSVDFSFFTPISAFDPFYDINDVYGRVQNLSFIEFELQDKEIKIEW
ncbi:MAG: glycoside hydrolase family 31 protein [Cytophagales bacterium]|nr:glycoside hydrolase family 31 protein [Cytophagales bacterium]MDW8384823.1 glycoside hydrolase family 31 protein [Flammeovirgaceae bacterium]